MPVTPPLRRPRQTITAHLGLHSEASLEAVRGTVQNSGDRALLFCYSSAFWPRSRAESVFCSDTQSDMFRNWSGQC